MKALFALLCATLLTAQSISFPGPGIHATSFTPFSIGLDFRATQAYVTDTGDNTYLTVDTANAYPITRGGATFGLVGSLAGGTADRNATFDPRIAGIWYSANPGVAQVRIDLPAAGTYAIGVGMGDIANEANAEVQVWDSTVGQVLSVAGQVTTNHYFDATSTNLTAAAWPGSNTTVTVTFTTTILIVKIGGGAASGISPLAHIHVTRVS